MFELILYEISEYSYMLIVFLMSILGLFLFVIIFTTKLKLNKFDAFIYGLFLKLKNIDIVLISLLIVRLFIIYYTSFVYSKQVIINIIMVGITSLLYIILSLNIKKGIFELINSAILSFALFLVNSLAGYIIDIGGEIYIVIIKALLSVFISIYATYFTLRNIEDVSIRNNLKRRKTYEER